MKHEEPLYTFFDAEASTIKPIFTFEALEEASAFIHMMINLDTFSLIDILIWTLQHESSSVIKKVLPFNFVNIEIQEPGSPNTPQKAIDGLLTRTYYPQVAIDYDIFVHRIEVFIHHRILAGDKRFSYDVDIKEKLDELIRRAEYTQVPFREVVKWDKWPTSLKRVYCRVGKPYQPLQPCVQGNPIHFLVTENEKAVHSQLPLPVVHQYKTQEAFEYVRRHWDLTFTQNHGDHLATVPVQQAHYRLLGLTADTWNHERPMDIKPCSMYELLVFSDRILRDDHLDIIDLVLWFNIYNTPSILMNGLCTFVPERKLYTKDWFNRTSRDDWPVILISLALVAQVFYERTTPDLTVRIPFHYYMKRLKDMIPRGNYTVSGYENEEKPSSAYLSYHGGKPGVTELMPRPS
jgi:hypothetical protein